jgi:hypothetical protein
MELALCLELLPLLLLLLLAVELVDTLAPDAVAVFDDDKLSDLDEELPATTLDSVELLTTSEALLLVVSTVLAVAAT